MHRISHALLTPQSKSGTASCRLLANMTEIVLLICLDGCGPEYLHAADMPSLKQLASAGRSEVGLAVMPTVTNVNNTSIVTGNFPRAHGITSNWCLDPVTRKGRYMESADDLLTDTIFERLETRGVQSAFLCVKEKLVHLLGRGATVAVAAENPPQWLIEEVGPVPSVYSAEINLWIFEALLKVILR